MDPNSAKVLPRSSNRTYRKRKADNVGQSSKDIPANVSSAAATPTENGNNNLRIGEFINKHFITEKDRQAFEAWGIEKCVHVLKAAVVEEVSIVRFMEQKVGDILKKNKACEEENTELKNKLFESEKNICNLKKDLEEVILKTSQLVESKEGLMEENAKMKAEIEDLKAKMEELRNEIIWQYKLGFDEAKKQVLRSVFELQS